MSSPEREARAKIAGWLVTELPAHSYSFYVSPQGNFDIELLDPMALAGAIMDDWQKLAAMVRPGLQARRDAEQ